MTRKEYDYYSEKDSQYLKKAKLFYGLFIAIFLLLIVLMFIYQIVTYFLTLGIIAFIMTLLYKFFFNEFIYYVRKVNDLKRVALMKTFDVFNDTLEYFNEDTYKNLFDDDFIIVHKNDVYILALKQIDDNINLLGIAVYFIDSKTEEVCPSTREISNELTAYASNKSLIKVILLVGDKFTEEEIDSLKYDSAVHHNTVVIGLEKSSSTLIYNYFLNGEDVDVFLGNLFNVDLKRIETEE